MLKVYEDLPTSASSIQHEYIATIKPDLIECLRVPPKKSTQFKPDQEIVFSNGESIKVNQQFIDLAYELSTDLLVDETVAVEVLYSANSGSSAANKGTNYIGSGRLAFFNRFQYILNILIWLSENNKVSLIANDASEKDKLYDNALESFQVIYKLLQNANDLIDKRKATVGLFDTEFVDAITFLRTQLFQCHELLATFLYSFVVHHPLSLTSFKKLITMITSNLEDTDLFVIHFLPSLMYQVSNLEDNTIELYYKYAVEKLNSNISDLLNLEVFIWLVLLVNFIAWCKKNEARQQKYNFTKDISNHIQTCINHGIAEWILNYTSTTCNPETEKELEWNAAYDFKSLLQKNIPILLPNKFKCNAEFISSSLNIQESNTLVNELLDTSRFVISEYFNENILSSHFHSFFDCFIVNSANVLTSLRDNEEDFLLSSVNKSDSGDSGSASPKLGSKKKEIVTRFSASKVNYSSVDLDEIASKAELERIYMLIVYTYQNRPLLCELFWKDTDNINDKFGFITWGLNNNTSPLITATFCLLLGSLVGNEQTTLKIWEILMNNNIPSGLGMTKKSDFSKISVNSIFDSLMYYIDALNDNYKQDYKKQEMMLTSFDRNEKSNNTSSNDQDDSTTDVILVELAEDGIVFISGFVLLLSFLVKNIRSSLEVSKQVKNTIFNRFLPVIKGFLKFDNMVIQTNHWNDRFTLSGTNENGRKELKVDETNRVVILNLMMKFLGDFVADKNDLTIRYKVWDILDRWLYHSLSEDNESGSNSQLNPGSNRYLEDRGIPRLNYQQQQPSLSSGPSSRSKFNVRINQLFEMNMTTFNTVVAFTELVSVLLEPRDIGDYAFAPYELLYPPELGYGYRSQIGIWPYMEFLMIKVFGSSSKLSSKNDRLNLQSLITNIADKALKEIDWKFIDDVMINAIRPQLNLNNIVENVNPESPPLTFKLFIKLHHSLAILNYFFNENTYKTLFSILDIGLDEVSVNHQSSTVVEKSLSIVKSILYLQDTFIKELAPILKDKDSLGEITPGSGFNTSLSIVLASRSNSPFENIAYPLSLGTNGVANFYELFVFNLQSVIHIALYIGSSNDMISKTSLSVLNSLSSSPYFANKHTNDPLSVSNRLLTAFQTVDEARRIQYGFINQFVESEGPIKFDILNFVLNNIPDNEMGIGHFLLGYQSKGGHLRFAEDACLTGESTLLHCIVDALCQSLEMMLIVDYKNENANIIDAGVSQMASLTAEVIVKLCKSSVCGSLTLSVIRVADDLFFEKLIKFQPQIDSYTVWHSHCFNGDLQEDVNNEFIDSELDCETFLSFINQRDMILQYFSLELQNTTSISRREYYKRLLLQSTELFNGSNKVLKFLDILNFRFKNFEIYKYESLDSKFNLSYILEQVKLSKKCGINFEFLEKLYRVRCQGERFVDDEQRQAFSNEVIYEGFKVADFMGKYIGSKELKDAQLRCLKSWCQLIEVLISRDEFDTIGFGVNKRDFVAEVFEAILPRIHDFLETDIPFSQELISLAVMLYDLYDHEVLTPKSDDDVSVANQRLIPLFKTCVSGILNSNLTPSLRSDLYVLANRFLLRIAKDKTVNELIYVFIKSLDKRFLEVVCNDSIYSEDSARITSILLLDSLVSLARNKSSSFVLDHMIRNNALLFLLGSIKRTDELLQACKKENSGISLSTLVYELTALKATLYLFIRISQTKMGALQLIQGELFTYLKDSSFLSIDPDIGLEIQIDVSSSLKNINILMVLDTPTSLNDLHGTTNDTISFYEFLIPIFQLIVAVLLSMGPAYKPGVVLANEFLSKCQKLIVGIMKRDYILETAPVDTKKIYKPQSQSIKDLKKLVQLFTLLDSLTKGEVSQA